MKPFEINNKKVEEVEQLSFKLERDIQKLKKEYDDLLKDEDFVRLDVGLKKPNIFQILKISTTEIRHSNFLSWLLDPKGSHKLGDIFLKRFLREVFSSDKFQDIGSNDLEGMDLSLVEVRREWENIDLLIILEKKFVVCVENKVYSSESKHQLSTYWEIIKEEFENHIHTGVFLTPDGRDSENKTDEFEPISYGFIVKSLDTILFESKESIDPQVETYITDYITIVKREIMETDEVSSLAKKIYLKHKELIEFIYKHRPDNGIYVSQLIKDEIEKNRWILGSESKNIIRFLTKDIEPLVYINKETFNNWNKNESFLFEIKLQPQNDKIIFQTVISLTDKQYNVEKLKSIMEDIDFGKKEKKPSGKYFFTYGKTEKTFNYHIEDQDLRKSITDFFEKISLIVSKVENKLVEHSEELLRMKSV
jgi:hypothetical protein